MLSRLTLQEFYDVTPFYFLRNTCAGSVFRTPSASCNASGNRCGTKYVLSRAELRAGTAPGQTGFHLRQLEQVGALRTGIEAERKCTDASTHYLAMSASRSFGALIHCEVVPAGRRRLRGGRQCRQEYYSCQNPHRGHALSHGIQKSSCFTWGMIFAYCARGALATNVSKQALARGRSPPYWAGNRTCLNSLPGLSNWTTHIGP